MKNRPLYLTLFPLVSLLVALSFPIQIYFLYEIPLTDFEKIFSMLTPVNLMTMSTLIMASILAMTLSKWIYKFIPILLMILFANNVIVGLYGNDYTLVQVILGFVLFGVSLQPFYRKDIKNIITNPNMRWWKTPKRYNIETKINLNTNILELHSHTANISKTGIFAKIDDKTLLNLMDINEVINIELYDINKINLKAKLVRKSDGTSTPRGFGLEFIQDNNHRQYYLPWLNKHKKIA